MRRVHSGSTHGYPKIQRVHRPGRSIEDQSRAIYLYLKAPLPGNA